MAPSTDGKTQKTIVNHDWFCLIPVVLRSKPREFARREQALLLRAKMQTTPAPGGKRVPYAHLVQARVLCTTAGPAAPKCACQHAPSSRAQIICSLQQSASC